MEYFDGNVARRSFILIWQWNIFSLMCRMCRWVTWRTLKLATRRLCSLRLSQYIKLNRNSFLFQTSIYFPNLPIFFFEHLLAEVCSYFRADSELLIYDESQALDIEKVRHLYSLGAYFCGRWAHMSCAVHRWWRTFRTWSSRKGRGPSRTIPLITTWGYCEILWT